MARIFLRIFGVCLLLSSLAAVRLHAQRGGGGRTAQDRQANAAPNVPSGQPANGQPAASQQPYNRPPYNQRPAFVRPPAVSKVPPQNIKQPNNGQSVAAAAAVPPNRGGPSAAPVVNGKPTPDAPFIGPQLPPPPPPLPPEKQPPTPPRVSFQNGLLTIECTNSRLIDVLNSVHTKADIQFEGLDSANERVAAKLGPAPADEVLSSLLQGSRFDYVILGHAGDPHNVERVLLSPHAGSGPVMAATPPPVKPQPAEEEEESSEEPPVEQPQPNPPPPQAVPPSMTAQPGVSGVQTPEQLLERLNKLKEEQQKNQGTFGQPNNTAPIKRPIPQ